MKYDFDIHEKLAFQEDALIWRPSAPDKKFMGKIEFDANQGISTSFLSNPSIDARIKITAESDPVEDEILFAETNKLGDVTLYDGFCTLDRSGWPGPAQSRHRFNQALLGAHIENPSTELFSSASIRLHNIEAFLAQSPIQVDWRPPQSVSFHAPEAIHLQLSDTTTASFEWQTAGMSRGKLQTTGKIEARPYLQIKYETPQKLATINQIAHDLIQLFEILTDQPFTIIDYQLFSPNYTRKPLSGGTSFPYTLRHLSARRKPENPEKIYEHNCLFTLKHIDDFQQVVMKWLSLYKNCRPAMSAYTAQRYDKGYVDSRFFTLASITESIHRELNPEKILYNGSISKQAVETVLSEVPEHAHDVVRSKLAWLNALSFKARLSELMQAANTVIEDIVGDIGSQKDFTRQVTDWRNEQAHMTDRRAKYASRDGIDYVRIAAKLKAIIDFQILLQLGFNEEVIARRMRELPDYWFYASNKTWPWRSDL